MLKRLSEAISQSNIESNSLASEICSQHSSCNFNTKQRTDPEIISFPFQRLRNYLAGGRQPSRN